MKRFYHHDNTEMNLDDELDMTRIVFQMQCITFEFLEKQEKIKS